MDNGRHPHDAVGGFSEPPHALGSPLRPGLSLFLPGGYVNAAKICTRGAAHQAATPGVCCLTQRSPGGPAKGTAPCPAFAAEAARQASAGHAHVRARAGLATVRDSHPARERATARGGGRVDRGGRAAGQTAGCAVCGLFTTNDSGDAPRFYQRRGFCLVTVHRAATERRRARLKSQIPFGGRPR